MSSLFFTAQCTMAVRDCEMTHFVISKALAFICGHDFISFKTPLDLYVLSAMD